MNFVNEFCCNRIFTYLLFVKKKLCKLPKVKYVFVSKLILESKIILDGVFVVEKNLEFRKKKIILVQRRLEPIKFGLCVKIELDAHAQHTRATHTRARRFIFWNIFRPLWRSYCCE